MHSDQLVGRAILVAMCVVLGAEHWARADDILKIENNTGSGLSLWVWRQDLNSWRRPELFLPRNGNIALDLRRSKLYWLVVFDDGRRELPVGWIDRDDVRAKLPDHVLKLSIVYESISRTEVRFCPICGRSHGFLVNEPVRRVVMSWGSSTRTRRQ
jgi:hypothetical protein